MKYFQSFVHLVRQQQKGHSSSSLKSGQAIFMILTQIWESKGQSVWKSFTLDSPVSIFKRNTNYNEGLWRDSIVWHLFGDKITMKLLKTFEESKFHSDSLNERIVKLPLQGGTTSLTEEMPLELLKYCAATMCPFFGLKIRDFTSIRTSKITVA